MTTLSCPNSLISWWDSLMPASNMGAENLPGSLGGTVKRCPSHTVKPLTELSCLYGVIVLLDAEELQTFKDLVCRRGTASPGGIFEMQTCSLSRLSASQPLR